MTQQPAVLQLRLVVEAEDYDEAVCFYRDVLGLPEQEAYTEARTRQLVDAGAELVAPPTVTPWQSLNARLNGPAGIHLTLFQELLPLEDRQQQEGFGTDADRHG
jgi:hypothetical protein